jgi:alkylated DNA nucleotide flippase Atl1
VLINDKITTQLLIAVLIPDICGVDDAQSNENTGLSKQMKSPHLGLKRVIKAAGYSWKGFKSTWKHEAAFRQEGILFSLMSSLFFG